MNTLDIINQVATYFQVSPDQITSLRKRPFMEYKHIAVYLCHKHTICTYESLAREFGLKSKCAISNSIRNVMEYPVYYRQGNEAVKDLEERITKLKWQHR